MLMLQPISTETKMLHLGQTEQEVMTALPPSAGRYSGWDWQSFYNAVLLLLQNPASQPAYVQALNMIRSLPAGMILTYPIMVAAWARFNKVYPYRDSGAAYEYMETLLKQANRLRPEQGVNGTQWWVVEQEWQALERSNLGGFGQIPRPDIPGL